MDAALIKQALGELGDRLWRRGVTTDILVFGGAAIALEFDHRRTTSDIDALILAGNGALVEAQAEVARSLDLPGSWLNEQATPYLSKTQERTFFGSYPSEARPGLRVYLATPQHLLAMKLVASRSWAEDLPDAVSLCRELGISRREDILDVLRRFFPEQQITPRMHQAIETVETALAAETPKPS